MRGRFLSIVQLGRPVLRRRSNPVRLPLSVAHRRLIDRMLVTMRKAKGVGIAAPQVGARLRIFIVAPSPSARYPHAPKRPPVVMINPKILRHSKATATDWEGCLSIPGIRGRVPRWRAVEVGFTARDGKKRRARLSGFVARIFQHEFEHINGHVFLDRVRDTRTFMTEQEYRSLR